MKIISVLVFLLLTAIAATHAYWAFGGLWPAASEKELIATVIGAPNMAAMPSREMTLIVAALIFTTGLIALAAGGVLRVGPRWLVRIAAGGVAFIFLARGAAAYGAALAGIEPSEPFATLNLLYYSPLCLAVGAAIAVLAIKSHPA